MNQHRPVAPTYDEDFFAWTRRQAELLRALDQGDTQLPDTVDLAHLAEEVEDLGKSELRGTTSLIRHIMVHLIKAASDPSAGSSAHWGKEAGAFHDQLPDFYTPSMRRLIRVDALWRRARKTAARDLDEYGTFISTSVPEACPFSLDEILSEDFRFDEALAALSHGRPAPPAS